MVTKEVANMLLDVADPLPNKSRSRAEYIIFTNRITDQPQGAIIAAVPLSRLGSHIFRSGLVFTL